MALTNVSLNIPSDVGIGSGTDTSGIDLEKTIQCTAGSTEILDVQVSNDSGTTWTSVHTFKGSGSFDVHLYAQQMRVNVSKKDFSTAAIVSVTGNSIPSALVTANVVVPSSGNSSTIDASNMSPVKYLYCSGSPNEIIQVQITNDNTTWATLVELGAGESALVDVSAVSIRAVAIAADYRSTAYLVLATTTLSAGGDSSGHGGEANDPDILTTLYVAGLTTSAFTSSDVGKAGYISGASTVSKTSNVAIGTSRCVGIYDGTSGRMVINGIISNAQFTTVGTSPSNGAPVYLAASTDDSSTGAGKLTATPPQDSQNGGTAGSVIAEVGICINNSNYASAKTCVVLIQPKMVIING